MAGEILNPSGLETISAGQQEWMTIYNTNWQKLNTKLGASIATAAVAHGSQAVADANAATVDMLTDSSGGTPATTIAAVLGSGADTTINNNFASLTAEITKLTADNASLRSQLNALLAALRVTDGMGILADNL